MISRRDWLVLSCALLAGCGRRRFRKLVAGDAILAVGDSLTAGFGAPKGADYPAQLAQILGHKVINGGVSSDTSAQALARLPDLLVQKPKLVVVSIGGNDFLQRQPESGTRENIRKMVADIRATGVPAVLVAIPHFTTGALLGMVSEHPLYAELADELDVPLLKGAWADILGDKDLKSDAVHANAAGYRLFAEQLAGFLRKLGLV
ncbi:GDSL-type esterase/lipase family protein [Kingella oralis]|uniref:GDSL-type esterase/lipase family protein n=1 Tax=Kingella oralis TaxID=505 RepID=UPI00398A7A71